MGMDKKKQERKQLKSLYCELRRATKHLIGYTISKGFDYSPLFRFLEFPINNIGDPYSDPSYLRVNTLHVEKMVVDRLAELFHAPKNGYWGYVTNGGTEGNLHGLYVARELYPNGVVFLSDQTHYSAMKNIHLLRMPFVMVKSLSNGEIDYAALQEALEANEKGPPIIFANIGTTMRGAIDDLTQIRSILSHLKIKKYYIHCDAAFYGMILPYVPEGLMKPFDFRAGIDSIAISGHKMIGSPIPCGVSITKKAHIEKIGMPIEYVGIKDTTISGSRNGVTPLFLWHQLIHLGEKRYGPVVRNALTKAEKIVHFFNTRGIPAWKNPCSLTIVLPRPSEPLARKWQLPVQGEQCCMIALPRLPQTDIDRFQKEFVADYKRRNK